MGLEDCALDQNDVHERIYKSYLDIDDKQRKIEEKIDALVVARDELNISRDFLLALYRGALPAMEAESYDRFAALNDAFDEQYREQDAECIGGSEVLEEEAKRRRTVRAATPIALCVQKGLWNLFTLAIKYSQQQLGDSVAYLMSTMIRSWDYTIREQLHEEEANLRRIWDETQDTSFGDALEQAQNLHSNANQVNEDLSTVIGETCSVAARVALMSCVQVRDSLAELDRIKEGKPGAGGRSSVIT